MKRKFLHHQKRAFASIKDRDFAALLMEMRLGKTLLAIRWALRRIAKGGRVLVVAPSTPLSAWMNELDQEGERYALARGSASSRETAILEAGPRWTLTTYESVWRTPAILKVPWAAVILDESTAIKNPKARVTKFILKHLTRAPVRSILTGLVEPQTIFEVWSQFAFLRGGAFLGFNNFWKFRQVAGYQAGFEWMVKKGWREKIKAAAHRDAFVLTRKQAGIGSKKVFERRTHAMDPQARKLYREAIRTWSLPGVETKYPMVIATWLRRIVGGHAPSHSLPSWKYGEVMELLAGELAREQVVIWFSFNRELARLWRLLRARGIPATWIAGDVALASRRKRAALFQGGERRVMLAQVKCAKMGIDLSAADTEIYFSSPWSFEDRRQSEDRIEHPKKKSTLLVLDLVTENSVDEDVMEAMKERRADAAWFVRKVQENRRGA